MQLLIFCLPMKSKKTPTKKSSVNTALLLTCRKCKRRLPPIRFEKHRLRRNDLLCSPCAYALYAKPKRQNPFELLIRALHQREYRAGVKTVVGLTATLAETAYNDLKKTLPPDTPPDQVSLQRKFPDRPFAWPDNCKLALKHRRRGEME